QLDTTPHTPTPTLFPTRRSSDLNNHTIRKITPSGDVGDVSTFAGSAGSIGSDDGTGSVARFDTPKGVAVDSAGNVYVADTDNNRSEEHTSELQSRFDLVCRLLLE